MAGVPVSDPGVSDCVTNVLEEDTECSDESDTSSCEDNIDVHSEEDSEIETGVSDTEDDQQIGPTVKGLLYISGSQKDSHLITSEMWSTYGASVYRCIMSEQRFRFLLTRLRFDDKDSRNRADKFGPIRELRSLFVSNCNNYEPRVYVTIDEQLPGFRGKCPFRIYISSKPDRYGIKTVTMCDVRTYYMVNAIPYIGKEERNTKTVHAYTVSRATRRWPLRMFYGVLDQTAINDMVLFTHVKRPNKFSRRQFLKDLGHQLAKPHMKNRLNKNLPNELRTTIMPILGI
ncbi:hypothetical protein PR048_027465 [Dryococelus australis]|uniref:PiggyBac transposable element-derived protein domain-containing protein n=1 Tax=Dryococelus australis TaxID=614101 RepID=A0ABQ9GFI8_9NEOP|nr:hypothetical protein PR048_027465 [Dryococelus australis]